MAIKVVVLDGGQLPDGVEFPPLQAEKYGWEQYTSSAREELAGRCWKADILVSLATPIERELLEKMHRLKLVITAGESCEKLDQMAAREQRVELLAYPDVRYRDVAEAQEFCTRVAMAIDHYIRNFER